LALKLEQHTGRQHYAKAHRSVPGQISLVFGVTGHRDLRPEDIETLESAVRGIFQEFLRRYPATPLSVLSPLAEGADRLVARVALQCGVRLVVPLPMPSSLYEMDFETAESRAEFQELLSQAEEQFEMPLIGDGDSADLAAQAPGREKQYAQVGVYIARQCQILLALWDGLPSGKVAGTADIVRLRSTGISARSLAAYEGGSKSGHLDPVETGPLFHLITPRACNDCPPADAFVLRREYHPREDESEVLESESHRRKNAQAAIAYDRIYANLDSYNRSAAAVEQTPWLAARRRQSEGYLMPAAEADKLTANLQALRTRHALADTLAQSFQQDTEKILIALSVLVFVAASLFETYEASHDPRFLLSYPLFLGVVYVGWGLSVKRGRWQDRYQDYRALAEGLRVAFFWRLVGQTAPVTDHYLRKQRSEMDWIRIAIQNAAGDRQYPLAEELPENLRWERWDLALKRWVEDQSRYFAGSAIPKNEKMLERTERIVKWLLIGSQIIPAGLAVLLLSHHLPAILSESVEEIRHWLEEGGHEHMLVAFSALMAVVAGLVHTYAEKKAFAQHVKQYKRMEHLFARAERRLRDYIAQKKEHQAADLLLELGRESLEENADWVLTHRERPVDVPHVG